MTDHDAGVARALADVRSKAESLMRALDDAEVALRGDRDLPLDSNKLRRDPLATADTFAAGDWVRPIGQPQWFQIGTVAYCDAEHHLPGGCVRVDLRGNNASLHLPKWDSLPYLTDAQFQADCEREQANAAFAAEVASLSDGPAAA